MHKVILASNSPRRKQLLEWAGIPFEVKAVETDETYPADLLPEQAAIYIARKKALAVLHETQPAGNATILAADTMVVLGNEVIGKPQNRIAAITTLKKLSGKKHRVITGVVILSGNAEIAFSDSTEVEFQELSDEQVTFYVDGYKPYDKAGAYAIQEWIGVIGIKGIRGNFYNVMGLPVHRVMTELLKLD